MAGRPMFKATAQQRDRVIWMRSLGMSIQDIATAVGIDRATLAAKFKRGLRDGPTIARQELMAMVMEDAAKGKPAAQRLLAKMLERDADRRILCAFKRRGY